MADIVALEAKVRRDVEGAAAEDLDLLARHFWQLAGGERDFRKRRTLLKRASHYAGHAFGAGVEQPESLALYRDMVQQAARVHSFPQEARRMLSLITARWLDVTGAGEHSVLARAKGKVSTETATFALGDLGLAPEAAADPWTEAQMVAWMNRGQRLFFRTGYDGTIKVELRVIDGAAPVLAAKEYGKLTAATPTVVLEVRSGRIAAADFAAMIGPWAETPPGGAVVVDAPPGRYQACVFGFETARTDSAIAVLCPTDARAPNAVESIDSLFM